MRTYSKKAVSFANIPGNGQPRGGDVLVSSFLAPSTGGRGQTVSLCAEQRHFNIQAEGQGSLRQAITYDFNNKSNEKQRLKSTKQIEHGVRFSSSLLRAEPGTLINHSVNLCHYAFSLT